MSSENNNIVRIICEDEELAASVGEWLVTQGIDEMATSPSMKGKLKFTVNQSGTQILVKYDK